jgi:hypothetical protein
MMPGPPAVTAPFLAASLVLIGAGLAKLHHPDDTARALHIAGLPSHRRLVRLGAAAEVGIGVAALARPGPATGSLVALAYAAFTGFVAVALVKKWPLASCGCFGRPDARPGPRHLLLDIGAAGAAVRWSVRTPGALLPVVDRSPWHGGPLILVTVVVAGLAYLVWTDPRPAARRRS